MSDKELYLHQFVIRHKDHGDMLRTEVRHVFISGKEFLIDEFKEFCKYNHQHCFCRYYRQLNGRLESKVKRDLIAHLVMHPDFNISKTDSLAKRYVANYGKDTVTRKWLFDFDSDDKELLDKFEKDLKRYYTGDYSVYKTVNGYHIVTENGFKDVDDLVDDYKEFVEFKGTDGFILVTTSREVYKKERSERNHGKY